MHPFTKHDTIMNVFVANISKTVKDDALKALSCRLALDMLPIDTATGPSSRTMKSMEGIPYWGDLPIAAVDPSGGGGAGSMFCGLSGPVCKR